MTKYEPIDLSAIRRTIELESSLTPEQLKHMGEELDRRLDSRNVKAD